MHNSTVICAPVYSRFDQLSTQVELRIDEGLKHDSSIHCDALVSSPKAVLTNYLGKPNALRLKQLDLALKIALELEA